MTKARSNAVAPAAKGDLVIGSGTNLSSVLGVGSANQVLTVDSSTDTGLKWAAAASSSPTFVGCRVTHSGNQTAANATNKILDWDTETFDSDGFHSTSSNTSRLTIPSGKAGKYLLFASISFDGNNTGTRYIEMQKNGSTFTQGAFYYTFAAANGGYNGAVYINIVDAAVSDYYQLAVWQNSGGNLTMFTQSGASWFCLTYLGA